MFCPDVEILLTYLEVSFYSLINTMCVYVVCNPRKMPNICITRKHS